MSEKIELKPKSKSKSATITNQVAVFRQKQAALEDYQDLRDDVISIVRNSKLTFEQIHERFGPTPATLQKWADKEVQRPQLAKMQTTLRACGRDLTIADGRRRRYPLNKFA